MTDARAEGYASEIDFWAVWCGLHDKAYCFRREKPGMFADRTYVEVWSELMTRPGRFYDAFALTFKVER